MPKNIQKQTDDLKRRPIHKNTDHSDENQMKKDHDDSNDSAQKLEHLYPVFDEEDNFGEKRFHYSDVISDEAELQNDQRRKLFENEKETRKGNIKEKCGKKNLSFLPKTTSTLSLNDNFSLCFLLIFVSMIGLGVFFYFANTPKHVKELCLKEKLKNVQDIFHDQNDLTFRILEKALSKVVNVSQEPSAPAIFTVTVNKNAIYKSHNFLQYISKMLAPESTVFINETASWHGNPDGIKLKIDNEIQSVAKEKAFFVVVTDNLQNVPPKGAMIFHSYCDHESAPYKQAAFIFILPLDEVLPKDAAGKKIDKAASQQLKNIWNHASSDEIDSLITRITVNVINIR